MAHLANIQNEEQFNRMRIDVIESMNNLFEAFDTDKNGSIEPAELAEYWAKHSPTLTSDEAREKELKFMQEWDLDGDGKVTRLEILYAMTEHLKRDVRAAGGWAPDN